jgi:hypothetical protein
MSTRVGPFLRLTIFTCALDEIFRLQRGYSRLRPEVSLWISEIISGKVKLIC